MHSPNSNICKKANKLLFFGLLLILFTDCKKDKNEAIYQKTNTAIEFAKGFDIQPFKGHTLLKILHPYPGAKKAQEFILVKKNAPLPKINEGQTLIRTPIRQLVVTSTTHIPMLELLNAEDRLVGFPNTQYISSAKTRKLIENGSIKDIGKEDGINTEILIDLNPDAIIGFSMSANNKMFSNIEKAGIPVLLNGDWLEETPLGRAEWIKFFGVLVEKEEMAETLFNEIAEGYAEAKKIAAGATIRPTVLSGVQFKEAWNLPAGESFVAQFLKDANSHYLWKDTKGKGSLSLSFETVLDKALDAEYWIAPGYYTSFVQLAHSNESYTSFKAFENRKIYSFTIKKGENGGALYYEQAAIQPHLVLKDLIKLFHPDLLPAYTSRFLEVLQP